MLKKVIEIQAAKFENSNLKVSCFKTWKDKKAKLNLKRSVLTWIIERLDRKLADAIGNVTSHYGEPFNLIRRFARLMFPCIFHYLRLRLYILAMF